MGSARQEQRTRFSPRQVLKRTGSSVSWQEHRIKTWLGIKFHRCKWAQKAQGLSGSHLLHAEERKGNECYFSG
eukprot:752121-Hanusia_phi.AAC.4